MPKNLNASFQPVSASGSGIRTSAPFTGLFLGLLLVWLLSACSAKPDARDYFPVNQGLEWRYVFKHEYTDSSWEEWMTIRAAGEKPVYFETGPQPMPVRQTDKGTDYYIQKDPDGIYRVARRLVVENKPAIDPKPRLILPQGENLRLGYVWTQVAQSYAVQWKPPFHEMNASIKPFDMVYEVASLNDTVDTPAGKFENCIRLDAYGSMTVYADPRTGYREIKISHQEWYAPGVGLVKLERIEPLKLDIITGGKVTMLLTRFKS